jgi:cephalosporin hydroxylase
VKALWLEQALLKNIEDNMDLFDYFINNTGKKITKWTHYFPVYEKHFKALTERPINILEIGVLNGGSLRMWKDYFHPDSTLVGIDIDPRCKQHEDGDSDINVRIGDQSNPIFLQKLIDEFGEFDLVIDDGSHHVDHVNKTFEFLYPKIAKNGIYLIEDTHAGYWDSHGGSLKEPKSMINVSKNLIDKLNADHTKGQVESDDFTKSTQCITFYDSMIVFERGDVGEKKPMETGSDKFVPSKIDSNIFYIRTEE